MADEGFVPAVRTWTDPWARWARMAAASWERPASWTQTKSFGHGLVEQSPALGEGPELLTGESLRQQRGKGALPSLDGEPIEGFLQTPLDDFGAEQRDEVGAEILEVTFQAVAGGRVDMIRESYGWHVQLPSLPAI